DLVGHVDVSEDRISDPIGTRNFRVIESDLFLEHAARRLQQIAFHDIAQSIGIDNESAIVRAYESLHANVSVVDVYLHLRYRCDERAVRSSTWSRYAASSYDAS